MHRKHGLACSSYVLRNGIRIKRYLPIAIVLGEFEIYKSRPTEFYIIDEHNYCLVSPKDVLEILEE